MYGETSSAVNSEIDSTNLKTGKYWQTFWTRGKFSLSQF